MSLTFNIARRYLFGKKSINAINIIIIGSLVLLILSPNEIMLSSLLIKTGTFVQQIYIAIGTKFGQTMED